MAMLSFGTAVLRRSALGLLALTACSLASACSLTLSAEQAHGAIGRPATQTGQSGAGGEIPIASATLEQCVTTVVQAERSATFSGEMTAIPGSARMTMRIDVQERMATEAAFHNLSAPGLGVWRRSDPKVKVYRYIKQVTDLSSSASYRAIVHFHWLNARGRVIRRAERLTPRCLQPAPPPTPSPPASQAPSTASPSPPASG
jgi:hypothetical protein